MSKSQKILSSKGKMPENLPSSIYAEAWAILYNCFGERMQQDELDLMDSVLAAVISDA